MSAVAESRVAGSLAALDLLTEIEVLAARDPLAGSVAARRLARLLERRQSFDHDVIRRYRGQAS